MKTLFQISINRSPSSSAEPGGPLPPGPAALPAEAGSASPQVAEWAVLELGARSRWLLDVHPGTTVVSAPGAEPVVARLPMLSLDWAVRLVLGRAGDVRALEPADLVAAVREGAAAALAAYPEQVP